MNADSAELEKWSAWGEIWWKPQGEFEMLHKVNPHRVGYIDRIAQLNDKTVLDVGCGGGILSESMAALGARVTGIDLADGVLEAARRHSREQGLDIRFLKTPVEELARHEPQRYDVVTCLEMLEHVPDPGLVIRSIGLLVKPEGHVLISTINRNVASWIAAIFGLEYVLRLVPVGTHRWRKFIKPSEIEGYCRGAGLEIDDWTGILYNPLTERFRLGRSTLVNYMLHARRVN